MFAYCRNNPIVLEDATGTADRACIYAESRIDDEPWRDHSPGGGGISKRSFKKVDLTEKINAFLRNNASILQQYLDKHGWAKAAVFFYNNVKDGGALDIKLQDDWKFESGTVYYYNGKPLRYDDPGNINFGYIGAILFPLVVLCVGAGCNQISNYGFKFGSIATFFDDPRDQQMIKMGYDLYRKGGV